MLVLTRKRGQKLIINDNIEIIIIETRGDTVKIGINAPKNVTIYREELYDEIKKSNKQVANIDDINNALNLIPVKKTVTTSYADKLQDILNKSKPKNE
ncbi:MAG: carbon storage regulator CsrA [Candidatus Gastranaerophilaceae bacterium]|jgi:carbon storage regulator